MPKILTLLLALIVISFGCEKDCKTKNPSNLSLNGCGNFIVYGQMDVNGNANSYIIIDVKREELILDDHFRSFDMIANPYITASIDELNKEGNNYCTDALDPEIQIIKKWAIVSGMAEI
jgi:hypothetical protein